VPFNDLSIQWRAVANALRLDFERIFAESAYCLGPVCEAFEEEISAWLCVRYAIAVSSGTAALHLATVAAGLGPGDEALVPANTFVGSVWGVMYVGATPVLCDVEGALRNHGQRERYVHAELGFNYRTGCRRLFCVTS